MRNKKLQNMFALFAIVERDAGREGESARHHLDAGSLRGRQPGQVTFRGRSTDICPPSEEGATL